MRNTTKLKHILLRYSICFDMDDDGNFKLTIFDKLNIDHTMLFEGKSYGAVLAKAYSYMIRDLKKTE